MSPRPLVRALASVAPLVLLLASAPAPKPVVPPRGGTPVIQVRSFAGASEVTIVGWTREEPMYGLRVSVKRDGSLRAGRPGYHALYMSTDFQRDMGEWNYAAVRGKRLIRGTPMRDTDNCFGGSTECSPRETASLLVADAVVREAGQPLVVNFYGTKEWSMTLDRPFLDRYLAVVDSVAASFKQK